MTHDCFELQERTSSASPRLSLCPRAQSIFASCVDVPKIRRCYTTLETQPQPRTKRIEEPPKGGNLSFFRFCLAPWQMLKTSTEIRLQGCWQPVYLRKLKKKQAKHARSTRGSSLPFCASIQFSLDSVIAFSHRIKIKRKLKAVNSLANTLVLL